MAVEDYSSRVVKGTVQGEGLEQDIEPSRMLPGQAPFIAGRIWEAPVIDQQAPIDPIAEAQSKALEAAASYNSLNPQQRTSEAQDRVQRLEAEALRLATEANLELVLRRAA